MTAQRSMVTHRRRRIERTGVSMAAVVAAALLALLGYGVASHGRTRGLDRALAHRTRPVAPDRPLPILGGRGVRSLRDVRGQVVVLTFWASWCPPCLRESAALERAQRRLVAHRASVLGVTFRDTSGDALAFVRRQRLTYPSVRDVDGRLAGAYGTSGIPETFLIDRAGRVAAIHRGPVDAAFLDRAVALASRT